MSMRKPGVICPSCGRQAVIPPHSSAPGVQRYRCFGGHVWTVGKTPKWPAK